MSDQGKDFSVLMPPPKIEGGLIKMPKKNPDTSEHTFKVPNLPGNYFNFKYLAIILTEDSQIYITKEKPKNSILGLDRLAAAKKKEKELDTQNEPSSKRSKVYSYKAGEEEQYADDTPKSDSRSSRDNRRDSKEPRERMENR